MNVNRIVEACGSALPQHGVVGAAALQRDAVAHLVADVDVHLVGHAQGQLHRPLGAGLRAHRRAVAEPGRQTELRTPLGDLGEGRGREGGGRGRLRSGSRAGW